MVGHAPAMVFGAVDDLIAYNPVTGEPMWSFGFPDDGQGMPALLAGGTVVVSEADGSVVGLSESDGRQLWRNPPPAGCASSGMQDLQPNAAGIGVMPGSAPGSPIDAVIGYRCPAGGSVVQIDPSDGVAAWKWPVPEGWTLDPQMASTVNTGSALGYVPVVPISLAAPANAPPVTAPAPGPTRRTAIDNVYGYSQSNDVVVLNPATAQPLWDLENVVGLGLSVVGGAGSLCVLTDAGGDCRDALTGVSLWSTQWPGVHASSRYPALNCVDMVVMAQRCAVSAGGLLYLALATDAAPGDANPPGRPESGIFVLTELNMATGASVASLPLPAFNPGPDGIGVCLVGPPAVLLVADGLALVSPQFEETDVIEAFALPASG
jgi:outer membrane protein assembly factor BamB